MQKHWEEEWKASILREALEETKKRVQTRTYKCFDEIFMKGESVKNTAEKMHISPNLVSQHKFKVLNLIVDTAKKIVDTHENYKSRR